MLNYPNVDLFVTRFNHKLPFYISPVLDNHALATDALSMDWDCLHVYAFPQTILIPSVLAKIRRIVLIAFLRPQHPWFSEVLQLLVSAPIRLPLFPKLHTSKGKVSASKSPITRASRLAVMKQSIRDKKFSQRVADFVSKSRYKSTQKVCYVKWVVYTNWCPRKKVNPRSRLLLR